MRGANERKSTDFSLSFYITNFSILKLFLQVLMFLVPGEIVYDGIQLTAAVIWLQQRIVPKIPKVKTTAGNHSFLHCLLLPLYDLYFLLPTLIFSQSSYFPSSFLLLVLFLYSHSFFPLLHSLLYLLFSHIFSLSLCFLSFFFLKRINKWGATWCISDTCRLPHGVCVLELQKHLHIYGSNDACIWPMLSQASVQVWNRSPRHVEINAQSSDGRLGERLGSTKGRDAGA